MARDERSLARVWFNKGALPKLGSTSNPQNQNFGINYIVSTELQGLSLARALNFFIESPHYRVILYACQLNVVIILEFSQLGMACLPMLVA